MSLKKRRYLRVSNHTVPVAHQFDDREQQKDASTLGMWVFLATEILFFGGMFMGYIIYRWLYPEAFALASQKMDLALGTINTAVLLTSSLTMALAVRAAQVGSRKGIVVLLAATMVLGVIFLGIKGFEYYHKFVEHLVPGPNFEFDPAHAPHAEIFFILYFLLTGVHALHLLIGVCLTGVIAFKAWRGQFTEEYYSPVEVTGLYWHFVDVIWIFLFPLLYLINLTVH
jgi:cytochrome c oxidase subunit III